MKVPTEIFVGTGWSELLAMLGVLATIASVVSIGLLTWLRPRLVKFFPTKAEYLAEIEHRNEQHRQNAARMAQVEQQMSDLATKHSLKGVEQKLIGVQHNQDKLFQTLAEIGGQLGGLRQSNDNVERLMGLVLNHMLQRDPSP